MILQPKGIFQIASRNQKIEIKNVSINHTIRFNIPLFVGTNLSKIIKSMDVMDNYQYNYV